MVPKVTSPLTKLIRTTEGVLVVAFNAVIGIAAVFGTLPGVQALKWAAIVNTATVLARSGLKAIALLSPLLGQPAVLGEDVSANLEQIAELGRQHEVVQSAPGTPAHLIVHGLAPGPIVDPTLTGQGPSA